MRKIFYFLCFLSLLYGNSDIKTNNSENQQDTKETVVIDREVVGENKEKLDFDDSFLDIKNIIKENDDESMSSVGAIITDDKIIVIQKENLDIVTESILKK